MKIFNTIQEGKWQEFLQDWIERRDHKKYDRDANFDVYFGRRGRENNDEHYRMTSHVVRVRAKNNENGVLHEIHILTATKRGGLYPIVCLVENNFGLDDLEEFDKFGNSASGNYTLYYEALFFEPGDYVVTNMNAIGVYANSWYLFWGIDGEKKEHLTQFGYGQTQRMATKEEIKLLNEVLWVNNKKWNKEKFELEDINK